MNAGLHMLSCVSKIDHQKDSFSLIQNVHIKSVPVSRKHLIHTKMACSLQVHLIHTFGT